MDGEIEAPELKYLLIILVESNHHVKEIYHYRLQFILKRRFGVRVTLKTIQKALRGSGWTLTFGGEAVRIIFIVSLKVF